MAVAPQSIFEPTGSTGLTQFSGRVYEEYLPELRGYRWKRVVLEMRDQDPIIGAVLFAIEMLIRQVQWHVAPAAANDPAAVADAAFVEECLHDMRDTWQLTLAEILSFLPWGWADLELVYKRRAGEVFRDDGTPDKLHSSQYTDGRIGWGSWAIRGQETVDRWDFDPNGEATHFWQLPPPDYTWRHVPLQKCLHFQATARKGNPEGRSILRNAYRPWYFKKSIENIEGIGIERDLAGLPVMSVPAEIMDPDAPDDLKAIYAACQKIVTNIRRDEQEGIILPMAYDPVTKLPTYDLRLLSTGGARQFDTNAIINRYNAQIAMTVLADFIVLGHEKVGSFALADSKTDLFGVALGAWLDSICQEINTKAIPDLLRYNGRRPAKRPELRHSDIESVDLAKLGAFITSLSGAGAPIFSGADGLQLLNHVLKQGGLPERSEPPIVLGASNE